MNWRLRGVGLFLCSLVALGAAIGGMKVKVSDPRYFEHHHEVIFPQAEVKLIVFEFDSVVGDERGKQRANELHDEFLARINDLQGGAIITYTTPAGERIVNYRVESERVAKEQKAQMVLWGRILSENSGRTLINARLALIEPPVGITARYSRILQPSPTVPPVLIEGLIDGHVTQLRVDFSTLESDVSPLVYFLSGLARYYKGAARSGHEAARSLNSSVADFGEYVRRVSEKSDATALANAHLYLARAYVRLADAEPNQREVRLREAETHAARAGRLDPYDADIPTAQAIIAARRGAPQEVLRGYLTSAVTLAPGDSNARVNLAVLEGAQGQVDEALRQLDKASMVYKTQTHDDLSSAKALRQQLLSVKAEQR